MEDDSSPVLAGSSRRRASFAHCLLIESSDGLVLVDTGFGTGDIADPKRLGQPFRAMMRPELNESETAVSQVRAMGRDPADVRHIVVTHLDLDHAGGLSDFPQAKVHVFAPELEIAQNPPLVEKARYIQEQWAHGPDWVSHAVDGDTWFGFESVKPIDGLGDDVALVPLVGHSKGHSGVAVRGSGGWMLHCGDAYFFNAEVETPRRVTPGFRAFENITQWKRGPRMRNLERLQELRRDHGSEVELFCSHDPETFDAHAHSAE